MPNRYKYNVIFSMFLYGTIGLFVRQLDLPSAVVSMLRGVIGGPFLAAVLLARGQKLRWQGIRRNLPRLCLLGAMLGTNWMLLFESYRYTSVATATLCYYLAPVFLVAASPLVFREKMTVKKVLCISASLVGMVFVSGAAGNGIPEAGELKGIALGIAAAVLYAAIVINNKKLVGISPYDRTIAQLLISALVLLPYNFASGNLTGLRFPPMSIAILAILGIVHTGLSYYLYFGSMDKLDAQTLAILSYIDPAVAILLSALVLREPIGPGDLLGAVLILGSALVSEYEPKQKRGS